MNKINKFWIIFFVVVGLLDLAGLAIAFSPKHKTFSVPIKNNNKKKMDTHGTESIPGVMLIYVDIRDQYGYLHRTEVRIKTTGEGESSRLPDLVSI